MTYNKSLRKALTLLRLFTPDRPEQSGAEIARHMNMHKTSTYRLLDAFREEGFLARDPNTGRYSIGPDLYITGNLFLKTNDLLRTADPVIRLLNDLTGEVANMSILDKGFITLVLREESRYDFRWSRHVGSVLPAYVSAMGWALLSDLSDDDIDSLYPEKLEPYTQHTVTTREALKQELRVVRTTGIAFDFEGAVPLLVGIGSPVRNSSDRTIAAISISVPSFRFDERKRQLYAQLVYNAAQLVSRDLGNEAARTAIESVEGLRSWWAVECERLPQLEGA